MFATAKIHMPTYISQRIINDLNLLLVEGIASLS